MTQDTNSKDGSVSEEDLKRIEIKKIPIESCEIEREFENYATLIPVCDFRWESYHTVASNVDHAATLAKEIALNLELIGYPQTFDLFSKDGNRVTLNTFHKGETYNNNESMFFMKEEFLNKYLQLNDLTLVWVFWGERQYSTGQIKKLVNTGKRKSISYKEFRNTIVYKCPRNDS